MNMRGVDMINNISIKNNYFKREGKGFFYLADTIWSAFTNTSLEEWEEYLDYRKMQGFNSLQINILPQWDRSFPDLNIHPFKVKEDGTYDFSVINEEYFVRAEKMTSMAVEKGFVPALVILWCNYVKGTWASRLRPQDIMPLEQVEPFTRYIGEVFGKFNPIFLISGDTNFEEDVAKDYYMKALKTIKGLYPNCLTTMHLGGEFTALPEEFIREKALDFYMYQSGHGVVNPGMAYKMALEFNNKSVGRPTVNGEPCYEGHNYGNQYGRFNEFDIRKAIWQSLLSGAHAGVTYGAHGIWSWHTNSSSFASAGFSGKPYTWREALQLKGSWDSGYSKWIFENYDLFELEARDALLNKTEEIRMAVTKDENKVVIYLPYNDEVKINMDLSKYNFTMLELAQKHVAKPSVRIEDGITVIERHNFNSDVLYIGLKA
jgi:hypothetical protein